MIRLLLNDKDILTDANPGTPLLDLIRYHQQLTGTKIGCREGDCGACTVLVGELKEDNVIYRSMTSCLLALGNAAGKHIVTIEGINPPQGLNPLQDAMAQEGATQCGFCTPGFVMSLTGFCLSGKEATKENAVASLDGNICRCTGYKSIERAATTVAEMMQEKNGQDTMSFIIGKNIIPHYFNQVKNRLLSLQQPSIHEKEQAIIVGGGTDLYVQQHSEMTEAPIRFVFDDPALNGIVVKDNRCMIGASVTAGDLADSSEIRKIFPYFNRYGKLISSTPIRNMATIGGNFVNASPIGDLTIFLLALDTVLLLSDGKTKREIPLKEFYTGYKQMNKAPGEIIEQIWFDLPPDGSFFHFEKVSKRTHLDIASVNTAIQIVMSDNTIERIWLSAGGVGPTPLLLKKTIAFLTGKILNEENILAALHETRKEISPISDTRGTKEYKTLLLEQLIKAHFSTLFPMMDTNKLFFSL